MSRKRTLLPDIYKQKKKQCIAPSSKTNGFTDGNGSDHKDVPNETRDALHHIRSLFPIDKFDYTLPPVIIQHQLYSIVTNRALVDKQITEMQESGEVKIFRLAGQANVNILVLTEDFKANMRCVLADLNIHKDLIEKCVRTVINNCSSLYVDRDQLITEYSFTEADITQLVNASFLTARDPGSWWISVPKAGIFTKSFTRGRKAVITMIKKCKYREVLRKDLEQRKWPRIAKLGLLYHIHDVIGAGLVDRTQTSSGELLRFRE